MSEITIIEDILAPSDTLKIRFDGKNPFSSVVAARELLRDVMKISSKDILETDFRWDVSGKNPEFYGKWMGRRGEDRWTKTNIRIIIQGMQSSQEKTGWADIRLKGYTETTYKYSNFLQRSFWWFFNRIFYHRQRQAYLDYGKDNMYEIRDKMKRTLGLEE